MARQRKQATKSDAGKSDATGKLPETRCTGVNAKRTKTVVVSALLEVTGHVRFGDGTDIATTITEKDNILGPNGQVIEKAIWAGTKRRGVDRRTIHELRNQCGWNGEECYIGNLCMKCPICWLYGFTGTTQQAQINAKSRVLYATSFSIEETSRCVNRHSRNQVNEKSQTTAGVAGIHEEEVIVAGTHFPIYTSLIHVLDWEIGVFAHAFLENLNTNRYTAASRAQGGFRLLEHNSEPVLVVDESPVGVFPVTVPKVSAWETDFNNVVNHFMENRNSPIALHSFGDMFQAQGFVVEIKGNRLTAKGGAAELVIEANGDSLVVRQGPDELMKRYYGNQAVGYLRQKQVETQKNFSKSKWRTQFGKEIQGYSDAIQPKGKKMESSKAATDAAVEGAVQESGDDSE